MVLALQDHFGYCPEAALEEISLRTGIPSARLHGMITFFDGLHERSDPSPRDKHYDCPLPPATADPMAGTAGPELLRDILTGRLDTARLFTVLRRLRHEIIEAPVISVPRTTCSCGAGAEAVREAVARWCAEQVHPPRMRDTGCFGWCSRQPSMELQLPGKSRLLYSELVPEDVEEILDSLHSGVAASRKLVGQLPVPGAEDWENIRYIPRMSWMRPQRRVLLGLSGIIDPGSIAEYIAHGGYASFLKSITGHPSRHVCDLVDESGLRGRGGGGFPTALKWKTALEQSADQKYFVCNAQESDPGSRIASALIESNPHQVLEGLAIAAYATGATRAWVVIRDDAPLALYRMQTAISQASATGLLGTNILGSGFNLSIKTFSIPGAFVCGEETALLSALEGRRGTPRHKPPYPASKGYLQYPTVVNNAETLANLPHIIEHGPRWFRKMGTPESPGTKLIELTGNIARPGLVEMELGSAVDEIIRQPGGGFLQGNSCKGVVLGGPLGYLLHSRELGVHFDHESLKAIGASPGSGRLMVLGESTCMVDLACKVMAFATRESCGKCIPCREGSAILHRILEDLVHRPENERGHQTLERFKGVMQMEELARVMQDTSQCGLGRSATNILLDSLRKFREEYDQHLFERHCRAGVCGGLRSFHIVPELCTGCNLCSRRCPEGAVSGSPRTIHQINKEKCTGCGICAEVCKFSAIRMN